MRAQIPAPDPRVNSSVGSFVSQLHLALRYIGARIGVSGLLGAQPAHAALAAQMMRTGNQLQEVVVTAQFRQQSAQTTPLAITAVSGQQLDERSIANVTDLNGVAPNVNITGGTSTNGPVAQIFIRGVGQSDGHPGLEPGVGLYVDDVYHGLMLGSEMDLTDLDRIEVLRGPQGTLSGKNSIGGCHQAILEEARRPDRRLCRGRLRLLQSDQSARRRQFHPGPG